jgi:benzoate membrane transport protein
MLAGVLFKFALGTFTAFQSFLSLSGGMFFIYILSKKFLPKYTIILVMITGIIISYFFHQLKVDDINYQLIALKYISPRFDLKSLIGIGLPLFIVTMTSQNLTGLAVLKSYNYKAPTSALITWSGIFNLIVAPFGGFAINLAAITAAICMGPDTHIENHKRYTSVIVAGIIYLFMGLFCSFFGSFFSTFPKEMIAVLTGLALIGTISNSLFQVGLNMRERDAAMLTFFITASGVTLVGVGAAFWGIFVGSIYFLLITPKEIKN